jgi:anti-sigma B factor antagonist
MMQIRISAVDGVPVLAIAGRIDSLTAQTLSSTLAAQIGQNQIRLIADLGGVDYMSSAGLRALLAALKETRRLGGDFRIASVQPAVVRVLELSGFTTILNMFPDVDAAVASFSTRNT